MYGVIFIYICHRNQPNVGKCIYNKWILWVVYIAILENMAMVQPTSQVLIFTWDIFWHPDNPSVFGHRHATFRHYHALPLQFPQHQDDIGQNLAVQGQMNSSHSQDQCIYPRNNMFPSIKGAAGS